MDFTIASKLEEVFSDEGSSLLSELQHDIDKIQPNEIPRLQSERKTMINCRSSASLGSGLPFPSEESSPRGISFGGAATFDGTREFAPLTPPLGGISAVTWNISAVNNNPFEYWMSHDDRNYTRLMSGVEDFIEKPGDRDVPVSSIFHSAWFSKLKALMLEEKWQGIDKLDKLWWEDFSKRKIVSGFLKDKSIGSKRLASMPDRVTNTIHIVERRSDGGRKAVYQSQSTRACRPTVINNYLGSLSSLNEWWLSWRKFMFVDRLQVDGKGKGEVKDMRPCEMLTKMSKAKYPALSEEEEEISLPLQMLCLAIFDAIMVHMMLSVSPDGNWQVIKQSIVDAIFSKKEASIIRILGSLCNGADVICLQECAASFLDVLEDEFGSEYYIVAPDDADPKRNQNSMAMLRKESFPGGVHRECTDDARKALEDQSTLQHGDLLVLTTIHKDKTPFLIASFHGDASGLATIPVISAVASVLGKQSKDCKLVFGMDANVFLKKREGMQDVSGFIDHCHSLGLKSCWSHGVQMEECCTTCSARTFLQPQLNKAVRGAELSKGDANPKDHIIVQSSAFNVVNCFKDSTGQRRFVEGVCLPSLQFPSDHGMVAAVFLPKLPPLAPQPGGISAATWNISAANNNPFEYWIQHQDKHYNTLMAGIENFIEAPGVRDVHVSSIFRNEWFLELNILMEAEGWYGCDVVERLWREDLSIRSIMAGFLTDKAVGSKRLASMPDRVTNTIHVVGQSIPACRPTVINNFVGSLSSLDEWWATWRKFMFQKPLNVEIEGSVQAVRPCDLLRKIKRSKYPALSEEEEQISLPLQALCLAIFDAIMVHVMLSLSPDGHWQKIKRSIVDAMFSRKDATILAIMGSVCTGVDIICLQECAAVFQVKLKEEFGNEYHIVVPEDIDWVRNQNSMALIRKDSFPEGVSRELTNEGLKALSENSGVERGDLLMFEAKHKSGVQFLVASFHGDTNGLATLPVLRAVAKVLGKQPKDCKLVFGLDANTYLHAKEGLLDIAKFLAQCKSLGLRSLWPDKANMADCCTNCSARTFLQPQLNKAVRCSNKLKPNPKDHIIVQSSAFVPKSYFKDNTGERRFVENECRPSLQFPSDHGIIAAEFEPVSQTQSRGTFFNTSFFRMPR